VYVVLLIDVRVKLWYYHIRELGITLITSLM
jgi:hypothetical protein